MLNLIEIILAMLLLAWLMAPAGLITKQIHKNNHFVEFPENKSVDFENCEEQIIQFKILNCRDNVFFF